MSTRDLDEEKKNILEKFRSNVQDVQQSRDDRFLLRWLRARKFDIKEAEKMLRADIEFRKKMGSDTILDTYKWRKELKPYMCTALLGFDDEGHVVRFCNFGVNDFKGFTRCMTQQEIAKLYIYVFENDVKLLEENNKKSGTQAETIIYIADLKGFKIAQFYDKTVLKSAIQVIKMYQDHYPERLHAVYIVNSSTLFEFAFNMIKPFLNEVVLKKVIFGNEQWQEKGLTKIPKDIIPAYLGGNRYGPGADSLCNDIINWNVEIPRSLYSTNFGRLNVGDPGVREEVIQQRSKFEVVEEVETATAFLCWEFQTDLYDIGFGLSFRKEDNEAKGKSVIEERIPVGIVDCHRFVEKGAFRCMEMGSYILLFDNTHSWFKSKHLLYKVEVRPVLEDLATEDTTY